MPEEKVSIVDKSVAGNDERTRLLTPAADAGPRQPEPQVSELLGKYLNTMVSDLRIERKGNYLRWLFSQYERELAIAPPVPQGAAPLMVNVVVGTPDLEGLNDALIAENKDLEAFCGPLTGSSDEG